MHAIFGIFVFYICKKYSSGRMVKHIRKNGMVFKRTKQRKVYKRVEHTHGNEEVRGYWIKCDIGPILISNN